MFFVHDTSPERGVLVGNVSASKTFTLEPHDELFSHTPQLRGLNGR